MSRWIENELFDPKQNTVIKKGKIFFRGIPVEGKVRTTLCVDTHTSSGMNSHSTPSQPPAEMRAECVVRIAVQE